MLEGSSQHDEGIKSASNVLARALVDKGVLRSPVSSAPLSRPVAP